MADTEVVVNKGEVTMTSHVIDGDVHMDSITQSIGEMDISDSVNNNRNVKCDSESNDNHSASDQCNSISKHYESVEMMNESLKEMSIKEADGEKEGCSQEDKTTGDSPSDKTTDDSPKDKTPLTKSELHNQAVPVSEIEVEETTQKRPDEPAADLDNHHADESHNRVKSESEDGCTRKMIGKGPGPGAVASMHQYAEPRPVGFPDNMAMQDFDDHQQTAHVFPFDERVLPPGKYKKVPRSPVENSDDSCDPFTSSANQNMGFMPANQAFVFTNTNINHDFRFGVIQPEFLGNDACLQSINEKVDSDEIKKLINEANELPMPDPHLLSFGELAYGPNPDQTEAFPSHTDGKVPSPNHMVPESPHWMVQSPDNNSTYGSMNPSPGSVDQNTYGVPHCSPDMFHPAMSSDISNLGSPASQHIGNLSPNPHMSHFNNQGSPHMSQTSNLDMSQSSNQGSNLDMSQNSNQGSSNMSQFSFQGSPHMSQFSNQGSPHMSQFSNQGSPHMSQGSPYSVREGSPEAIMNTNVQTPDSGLSESLYHDDSINPEKLKNLKVDEIAKGLKTSVDEFESRKMIVNVMEKLDSGYIFTQKQPLTINPSLITTKPDTSVTQNPLVTQNTTGIANNASATSTCTPLPTTASPILPHESLMMGPMSDIKPSQEEKKPPNRGRGRPKGSKNRPKEDKKKDFRPKQLAAAPPATTVILIPSNAGNLHPTAMVIPMTTTGSLNNSVNNFKPILPKGTQPSVIYAPMSTLPFQSGTSLSIPKPKQADFLAGNPGIFGDAGELPTCRFQSSQSRVTEQEVECSEKEKKSMRKARRLVADIPTDKLNYQDGDGDTLLHDMSLQEYMDFLELLFPNSSSLLTIGVVKDRYMFRALIERMENEGILDRFINASNNLKQTPLYLAVCTNKADLLSLLIEKNADPNTWTYGGRHSGFKRALHVAAEKGKAYTPILKVLLKAKDIDVNAKNSDQKTALHCAVEHHGTDHGGKTIDNKETVEILMQNGAEILKGPNERTPLHTLAERLDRGFLEFMVDLLPPEQQNEKLNMKDSNGNTCLHIVSSMAGKQDQNGVVRGLVEYLLLKKGVDYCIQNQKSERAKGLCNNNKEVMELFTSAEKMARNRKNQLAAMTERQRQVCASTCNGGAPVNPINYNGHMQNVPGSRQHNVLINSVPIPAPMITANVVVKSEPVNSAMLGHTGNQWSNYQHGHQPTQPINDLSQPMTAFHQLPMNHLDQRVNQPINHLSRPLNQLSGSPVNHPSMLGNSSAPQKNSYLNQLLQHA